MIHVPCQRLDLKMCLKIQGGVQANQGHYLGLFGLIWAYLALWDRGT
jgi:hypothetical protein